MSLFSSGLGFLIHLYMEHLDSLEIIGIKIESNELRFDFYSLYSPPSMVLPYELFSKLETEKNDFVIVGDMNAKSKSIGC